MIKIIKKITALLFAALFVFIMCICVCSAQESLGDMQSDWLSQAKKAIPEDISEALPEEMLSIEYIQKGGGISVTAMLSSLLGELKNSIEAPVKTLGAIVALLIASALMNIVGKSIGSVEVTGVFSIVSGACLCVVLLKAVSSVIGGVEGYIEKSCVVISGMLPVMGAIYAAGGNAATAVASSAGTSVLIAVCEGFCAGFLIPVMKVCAVLAAASFVSPYIDLGGFAKTLKSAATFFLGLVGALISAALAFQTFVSSSADSFSMRTVKFASGNLIPVVGTALGDAVKTVAGGISVIKNAVGSAAAVSVVLVMLPGLVTLLLYRTSFGLGCAAARIMNCKKEAALLEEMQHVCGFALAVLSVCTVMLLSALIIYVITGLAMAA